MDLSVFTHLVRSSVAFRLRLRLQPAAGPGTKVFPPTYSGPIYATESRYLPGVASPVVCVLLDSQASQANRMEQALLAAWRCGRIQLPVIYSDFPGPDPDDGSCPSDLQLPRSPGRLTSLEVPHRISDAILRDSVVPEEGRVFRSPRIEFESSWGQRLRRAHLRQRSIRSSSCRTALAITGSHRLLLISDGTAVANVRFCCHTDRRGKERIQSWRRLGAIRHICSRQSKRQAADRSGKVTDNTHIVLRNGGRTTMVTGCFPATGKHIPFSRT